jgi:hypothetical protein
MSKPIFALPFQGHTLDVLHLTYNIQAILLSIFYLANLCIVVTKTFGKNDKIEKKNPNSVAIGTGSSSLKDEN